MAHGEKFDASAEEARIYTPNKLEDSNPNAPLVPAVFNVYHTAPIKTTKALFYAAEDEAPPIYTIKFHLGWSSKSDLAVHAGPDIQGPVVATAESASLVDLGSQVTLLARPGSGARDVREKLHYRPHLTNESYTFTIDTGSGEERQVEKFEWRFSLGKEVKSLHKTPWGWKLVRLNSVGSGRGKGAGESGDGKEIVAIWADTSITDKSIGRFEFINAGATGELGEAFAMMAFTTGVRIWQTRWYIIYVWGV